MQSDQRMYILKNIRIAWANLISSPNNPIFDTSNAHDLVDTIFLTSFQRWSLHYAVHFMVVVLFLQNRYNIVVERLEVRHCFILSIERFC